ncbi:MAG TPA: hypothetical protein VKY74_21815 [Chloroflexia bacterium]|nr:hypothetical protein [Chloroflexia bacterium]
MPAAVPVETAPAARPAPGGAGPSGRGYLGRLVLGLVLLLAGVDALVVAAVEPLALADRHAKDATPVRRLALYHQAPRPDVLLLGSSRVQAGLSPSLLMNRVQATLGRRPQILNLGLAGGTPQANYWLLKNAITADKQPALIIYGTSEYEFNPYSPLLPDNYADELATLADYGQAFPDPLARIDAQLAYLLGRPWHLVRYRGTLHDTLGDLVAPDDPAAPVDDAYGFLPLNHQMTAIDVRQMRATYLGPRGYLRDYTVQGYQATRFEQLLALAQARGIRVAVINMPITTVHEHFLAPADYAAYRTYLQTTTARYGVPFVDYNNHALWQEPGDFADTHHLNRVGAKKLSQLVSTDVLLPALR